MVLTDEEGFKTRKNNRRLLQTVKYHNIAEDEKFEL